MIDLQLELRQLQQRNFDNKYLTTPISPDTMAILEEQGNKSLLWESLVSIYMSNYFNECFLAANVKFYRVNEKL